MAESPSKNLLETLRPFIVIEDVVLGPLYHGTSNEASEAIRADGFKISTGDDSFLGPGVYFWEGRQGLGAARWWSRDHKGFLEPAYFSAKARISSLFRVNSASKPFFDQIQQSYAIGGRNLGIGAVFELVFKKLHEKHDLKIDAVRKRQNSNVIICVRNPTLISDVTGVY